MGTPLISYYAVTFANGVAKKDAHKKMEFIYDKEQGIKIKTSGVEFVPEKIENPYSSHFICSVDHETKSVTYHPAEMVLMTMKPSKKADSEVDATSTYLDKTLRLAEEFGTAKMKRDARSRKRRSEVSQAAALSIEQNFEKLMVNHPDLEEEAVSLDDDFYQVIPKRNNLATCQSEIYCPNDIIPSHICERISKLTSDFMEYCENTISTNSDEIPMFVSVIYTKIKGFYAENPDDPHVIYFLYWYYLYTFFSLMSHRPDWKEASKLPSFKNIPPKLRKHMKQVYTVSKTFPPSMKTKTVVHLILLSFFITDYNVDCIPIMKDLKLKFLKMKLILKALGCNVSHSLSSSRKRKKTNTSMNQEETREAVFTASLALK